MPILMPPSDQLAFGTVLAAVVAGGCCRARLLSVSGAFAAAVVGAAVVGFGGWAAGGALLLFFGSSSLLSRWRKQRKAAMRFEKGSRRDAGQVLANGGVAAVSIVAAFFAPAWREALTVAFLAALAEANADTWATEIGAASAGTPRMITTLRRAPPGVSGAVSIPGTLAALAGAALIGAASVLLAPGAGAIRAASVVVFCGFSGSLCDSLLGATIQAQYSANAGDEDSKLTETCPPAGRLARGLAYIGNDAVNLIATFIAAALAFVLEYQA